MLPRLTRKRKISYPFQKNNIKIFETLHYIDKPYEAENSKISGNKYLKHIIHFYGLWFRTSSNIQIK
jgi:hypothetical protein